MYGSVKALKANRKICPNRVQSPCSSWMVSSTTRVCVGLVLKSHTGCTVSPLLSNVTETPGKVFQTSLLFACFEENLNKLCGPARGVWCFLVSLSSFSDFSAMASCSSKVYLKLNIIGSSETLIACGNIVGFLQFIKGRFMPDLWRIYHGNVRLLVLAVCVQGLAGRSVYKGYSYDMERVSYCKTRGKKKNQPTWKARSGWGRHKKEVGSYSYSAGRHKVMQI